MAYQPAYVAEQCRRCRFYFWLQRQGGRCRRFPPTLDGAYPRVAEEDWCGEWREPRRDQPNFLEEGESAPGDPGAVAIYRGRG